MSLKNDDNQYFKLTHYLPMSLLVTLIILYLFGYIMWRSILRKGAYPPSVNWNLKWFHAFIFCYLQISFLFALGELFWLIHYPANSVNPVIYTMHILACASGLTFPFISNGLAKRQVDVLKWYFIAWPTNFISENCIMMVSVEGKHPISSVVLLSILTGIFIATICFYLNHSVKERLFMTPYKKETV